MQNPFLVWGGFRVVLLFLHHALQRVLVFARKIHHLRDLGLGNFISEHAALTDPVMMDVEHDLGGGLDVLLEEFLQDVNDKLHRSVVVVQNQDAVQIGALGFGLDLRDDGSGRTAGPPAPLLIIAHASSRYSDCGGWRGTGGS